ncbi:MAG: cbb3-type cytochrome c oxidase subunit I [Gemmatimonadales bacterium]
MPRLSVLMIRTSLLYLAAGFLAGALMLANRGVPFAEWVYRLRPVHIEFLLLGWTVQLALGMAFWILPRFRSGRERGREELAWGAFALLNAGVLGTAIGGATGAPAIVALLGRSAEGLAALTFALHAWPRVKIFGAG